MIGKEVPMGKRFRFICDHTKGKHPLIKSDVVYMANARDNLAHVVCEVELVDDVHGEYAP